MTNQPTDPRDERIAHLEDEVQQLKLLYDMQFGNDRVAGAVVSLLTTMSTDLKDVKTALFGDAATEKVGLLVRLDRLEQWSSQARWVIGVLFTFGVGQMAYIFLRK